MKHIATLTFLTILSFFLSLSIFAKQSYAVEGGNPGYVEYLQGAIALQITGAQVTEENKVVFEEIAKGAPISLAPYLAGTLGDDGSKQGLLPTGGTYMAMLYQVQPSGKEYVADILNNIGIPTVNSAYAQGSGYKALSVFLPFWKAFRNVAYTLYIIMFFVVGIMIMLRTKINSQTIISIQSALPNLVITLILITFSYAIVGFMVDLMYFLIYVIVYIIANTGIISSPTQTIDRLLSYSAWSVLFEGRNSIVSAISLAISEILSGLGTGVLEVAGTVISWVTTPYIIVAVALAIAMLKLMVTLLKSYIMLIVQTITAPIQILMNAVPGSKAFSNWLKRTASYLIPFPVAAAMFIFAAVLIGDPTKATIWGNIWPWDTSKDNPFGINPNHEFYQDYGGLFEESTGKIWMPPFTLTASTDLVTQDILTVVGFIIFTMTPATVKMAQDWLQVKESPYTAEAFANIKGGFAPVQAGIAYGKHRIQLEEQRKMFSSATKG